LLHASFHNKTTYFKRYHPRHLRLEGERIHAEDEITSTFLGALDFMHPDGVFSLWQEIFNVAGRSQCLLPADLPHNCPLQSAEIKLWPRRNGQGITIEPDAFIEFQWQTGHRRFLLLESKWEAPLSPRDQLQTQWTKFLNSDEQRDAYHLFIAKNSSAGVASKNQSDVWGADGENRLLMVTWEQIRTALVLLRRADGESTALSRFAEYADSFLEKIGIGHFVGFQIMTVPDALPPMLSSPLFWRPFNGFSGLPNLSNKLQTLPETLCFTAAC
jgi:hypothetical protein